MSSQQVPQAPNYQPLIGALTNQASNAGANGANSLAWAQQQVANNKGLTDQVNAGLLDTQGTFDQAAKDRLASGTALQTAGDQALNTQYAKYTDPNRVAADMGASEANAAQADEAARNASTQSLESFGVNPGATRMAALDIPARLQDAATRAGAGNIAARTDAALADTTNAQRVAQGNAESGQANANAATGGAAGTGAVNTGLATTASGYQGLGTDLAWTGAGTNALTGAVNATNTGFQNVATSDQISNAASSGVGSALGLGLSALGKGGALASGGALAPLMMLAEGGAVPAGASPSHGAVTDDVAATSPAGPARLNAGEFVLPKDTVGWLGEEKLHKMIQKSREDRVKATARPAVRVGPSPASPAFQPRPQQQGAVPLR